MKWERFEQPAGYEDLARRDKEELEQMRFFKNEFEPAMAQLVEKLQEGLSRGEWSVLLGDDVSGRLPTLVLLRIMKRIAEQQGYAEPEALFMRGGTEKTPEQQQKLREYVAMLKEKIGDRRVLFVTEYIGSGRSLQRNADMFVQNGVSFDVVAVSRMEDTQTNRSRYYPAPVSLPPSSRLIVGGENDVGARIWERKQYAGLDREDFGKDVVARRDEFADRTLVNTAREFMVEVADELYEKYFKDDTLIK